MTSRTQKSIAITILVLGILLHLLALNTRAGLFVILDRGTTVPVGSTVLYGAVVRLPASGGWTYIRDGAHVSAGFTTLKCRDNGILRLYMTRFYNVASVWVSPDETLSRRGILAGASVNREYMDIKFTRVTGSGPIAITCRNSILRGDLANIWVGAMGQPQP